MAPRVTVVVPAYNYGRFLGGALDSVLAQTMADWECVIVDDGSTDDTPAVARAYTERDPRFRYIRQDNAGLSATRNTALRNSSGTYIQLLDADDKLAADKLELHSAFLDAHPEADLVYSGSTFFRTEEPERVLYSIHGQLSRPLLQKVTGTADALERLQEFNITPPIGMFFRRSVIDRVGLFNEAARSCEDWDYWLRCAIAGCSIVFLPAPHSVGFMRTHEQSLSRSSEGMLRGLISAARTFPDMPAARQWPSPMLPRIYEMVLGVDEVQHGRRRSGVRRIWRAARAAKAPLTRLRWMVYAAAGCILPRPLFRWVVTRPMPERGLELIRRLKRT